MPGFILHLTAAQILLKRLPHHPDFPYEISSVNDFLIGNLLPDTTKQKDASHFRNPAYYEKMMVFPDLTRFLQKYSSLLANPSVLGYYFHLYIDRKFFKDFIPQVVEFMTKMDRLQIFEMRLRQFIFKNQRLLSHFQSISLKNIITEIIQG